MKRIAAALLTLAVAMAAAGPAHAAPSQGPDPADFTYSTRYGNTNGTTRTVDYVVATSAYNTILSSRLNIYLPSSTGAIVIHNYHICYGTFQNGGRNYDQLDDGVNSSSGNTVSYRIGTTTLWGAFDSALSCDSKTITFNVSGATLDPNTGMYKYQLVVTANAATDKYMNTYWVTGPTGTYVSQDSSLPTSSFALNQTSPIPAGSNPSSTQSPPSPYQNYTNYNIKFAPDCSLTTASVAKTIEIYDDDNLNNWDVQPRPFLVRMIETDVVSGASVDVPLTATFPDGSGSASGPSGGYYTFGTTANAKRILINFTVKKGKKYQWLVDSVYYDNTLQFKLPYDNVYYYLGCALPEASYKAGMTPSPSTMNQDDTATFTPSVSVAGFRAVDTVNCSITRTFYPASGGSSSLGSQPCTTTTGATDIPITGNGTITLAANTYSSPSTAVPGSRICDTITITNPSDPKYFAASGDETSTGCVTITKTPSVQFLGGDVWAGGGFAAVAPGTCNTGANITTSSASSTLSDGTRAGSGVTYSAFALGKITNFGSASMALSSGIGDNWTFSNINSGNLGYYGAAQHCITDYVSTYNAATPLAAGVINAGCGDASCGGGGSGAWKITGDSTFNGTMLASRQKVYYVVGNVTINGDLRYPAAFAGSNELPSLVIIATGNIYVSPGVQEMNGIFITRGTFYTCYPKTEPATMSTCNSRLVVNGSVSANAIDLFRTAGADGSTPASRKTSAEAFNLSPEVFITNALNTTSVRNVTISNVHELPPRF